MKKLAKITPKKSLQKFTVSDFENLLKKDIVTMKDLNQYGVKEKERALNYLFDYMESKTGIEKLNIMNKCEALFAESTRNQLWENNHVQVTCEVDKLLREYNRMPSVTEIANSCGLSRVTVDKHMKELKQSNFYSKHKEQYEAARDNLISKLYKHAVNGDMKAAKLFLENTYEMNEPKTTNRNNFIQINNIVLSQENIQYLKPEQLNAIETILKTALPQPQILTIEI